MGGRVRDAKRSRAATAAEDQPLDAGLRTATIPLLGFEWQETPSGDPLLVPRDESPSAKTRTVAFSSFANLFRIFVDVKATEEGFLGFANEYGLLQLHSELKFLIRHESLWEWTHHHQLLAWTVSRLNHPSPMHYPEAAREIESRVNGLLLVHGRCGLVWNERRKRYTLKAYPVSLLGLMWWQVARVITGEVVYTSCEQCDNPIETGPDGHHIASKRFCSAACNQKHHRARVKEAKSLRASGLSVSKIAKQLDTTPNAINHWLTKVK